MQPWRIWVDTGGTFTDCIATAPDGAVSRLKVLSSSVLRARIVAIPDRNHLTVAADWPVKTSDFYRGFTLRLPGKSVTITIDAVDTTTGVITCAHRLPRTTTGVIELTTGEEVPVLAARLLTATPLAQAFPPMEMKLGSTRGTNAILERKGARTALLVTRGFRDLLRIGNQQRPDLFTLNIIKPEPLADIVIEVDERIDASGNIVQALEPHTLAHVLAEVQRSGAAAVAIALVNSYRNPIHETALADFLTTHGVPYCSQSHRLSSQIRILPRATTTVANAYLAPIIHEYVSRIQHGLADATLKIMSSAGGLLSAGDFQPKDSLLSGPAGGVVGAARTAARSGIKKIIGFDMGGTSTDVSLYDGQFDYRYESVVGNQSILSPSLAIETIAAGGGSICDFDGFRLTVGPHSAGAAPGPACYGAGGPLTITDVNLLLGKIYAADFSIPLYPTHAEAALGRLQEKLHHATGKRVARLSLLQSLALIANEKMAEAIRKVSVQKGYDPADYVLLSFGGAGGQHACALAEMLGMQRVLVPYEAGLLSAYGIGHATEERFEEKLVLAPLRHVEEDLESMFVMLETRAKTVLQHQGFGAHELRTQHHIVFLRFAGQDSVVELPFSKKGLDRAFRHAYEQRYGHTMQRPIEVESVRVVVAAIHAGTRTTNKKARAYQPKASDYLQHNNSAVAVYCWEQLLPGAVVAGPAVVYSRNSTTVVDAGWRFALEASGNALLQRQAKFRADHTAHAPAAQLELFTNRFTAIAHEMGALLQRTSFSVNVKERLDFSCALLDPAGRLVVNAPHIPVHLGSLGVCVREVVRRITVRPGDVIITNHPAYGGSHLPDVTLIKPVYQQRKLVGYVATRAHHAEIGGREPGSMPADATRLEEEGVIIAPTWLVRGGKPQWSAIRKLLTHTRYPTRAVEENLADLRGALAAITFGEKALIELCEKYSAREVVRQMGRLRQHAAGLLVQRLRTLKGTRFASIEKLDDGSVLQVKMKKSGGKLRIDFSGSAAVHPGNLNATRAIVQSAVLYVLRLLVDQPMPMNEGMMEPVELVLPHGLLNPDFARMKVLPAVVGGNTEVSQRLTDTLLKAFGLAACSQGTMNNFLFGNAHFGYYETICGGVGAGPGFHGAHAVHQHMTNTRITDPEIMEFRYPVQLEKFEIRRGSGGKGRWNGGDGIIRQITFKAPLQVNLLTQHRVVQPYGVAGGKPGKAGHQFLERTGGTTQVLRGMDQVHVSAGDVLTIETPGGGGWGIK